jgi:hypothetical protein
MRYTAWKAGFSAALPVDSEVVMQTA